MAEIVSDDVVLPDMAEVSEVELSVSADDGGEADRVENGAISLDGSDSGDVISEPVSLPVSALIPTATYNLLTGDRLPQFKASSCGHASSRVLCVDNGCISGGGVSKDIKSTHLVLQSPQSVDSHTDTEDDGGIAQGAGGSGRSWTQTANMPILPVRCKNTSAELHKDRFGSGGRGKCIKYNDEWFTPSGFEAICGRGSSKDWKRSIRFGGRSIHALIEEGILTPHATSCTCGACCDDQTAKGPIRLFTPYKRRRRNRHNSGPDTKKSKDDASVVAGDLDSNNMQQRTNSIGPFKEALQQIADGLNHSNDFQILDNTGDTPEPPVRLAVTTDVGDIMKRLHTIAEMLSQITAELINWGDVLDNIKSRDNRGDAACEAAREAACETAQEAAREVARITDQAASLDDDDEEAKRCANCNRLASAECSLCRRTPYCSIYCQKKDWASHQIECLRTAPTIHQDPQQHQSIMLIVESHQ